MSKTSDTMNLMNCFIESLVIHRLMLPMHNFCEGCKFSFRFLILRFQLGVLLLTKGQVVFQCLQKKTKHPYNKKVHKHTATPQTQGRLSAHAGVIKNNTAPVTCQFYYSQRSCTSVQRYQCFIRSQPQIHCASSHFQTAPVDENELHLLRFSHPVPLSPGPAQRSCHPSCAGEHKPGAAPAAALAPWR